MNERLMEAVLYAALFFETSSDDECDPDIAVKRLEEIGASLQQMSHAEQDEFRVFAMREANSTPSPLVAEQIRKLVDGLLPKAGQ